MTDANPDYLPRTTDDPSLLSHRELVERVEEAKEFCKEIINRTRLQYVAKRVLKILEGEK